MIEKARPKTSSPGAHGPAVDYVSIIMKPSALLFLFQKLSIPIPQVAFWNKVGSGRESLEWNSREGNMVGEGISDLDWFLLENANLLTDVSSS